MRNARGMTVMHKAAAEGHLDSLLALINHVPTSTKSAPNLLHDLLNERAKNTEQTPLHLAVQHNRHEIVRLFMVSLEIDFALAMPNGDTALHYAIREQKDEDMILMLMRADPVCVKMRNHERDTPKMIAKKLGTEAQFDELLREATLGSARIVSIKPEQKPTQIPLHSSPKSTARTPRTPRTPKDNHPPSPQPLGGNNGSLGGNNGSIRSSFKNYFNKRKSTMTNEPFKATDEEIMAEFKTPKSSKAGNSTRRRKESASTATSLMAVFDEKPQTTTISSQPVSTVTNGTTNALKTRQSMHVGNMTTSRRTGFRFDDTVLESLRIPCEKNEEEISLKEVQTNENTDLGTDINQTIPQTETRASFRLDGPTEFHNLSIKDVDNMFTKIKRLIGELGSVFSQDQNNQYRVGFLMGSLMESSRTLFDREEQLLLGYVSQDKYKKLVEQHQNFTERVLDFHSLCIAGMTRHEEKKDFFTHLKNWIESYEEIEKDFATLKVKEVLTQDEVTERTDVVTFDDEVSLF
jgi:hypothetical protein